MRPTWAPVGYALDATVPVLRAMREARPLEDLARVEVPVWIVNGALDHFRGEERRFVAACGDGRLVVVPGATHLVSVVAPVALHAGAARRRSTSCDAGQTGWSPLVRMPPSAQARTPPTIPAWFGTTMTRSPEPRERRRA